MLPGDVPLGDSAGGAVTADLVGEGGAAEGGSSSLVTAVEGSTGGSFSAADAGEKETDSTAALRNVAAHSAPSPLLTSLPLRLWTNLLGSGWENESGPRKLHHQRRGSTRLAGQGATRRNRAPQRKQVVRNTDAFDEAFSLTADDALWLATEDPRHHLVLTR